MRIVNILTYDRNSNLFHQENNFAKLKNMNEALKNKTDRAVNVEISEEGMAAFREKVQEMNPESAALSIYDELITPEDTNEIEMEHFFAMREYCGLTLKDGEYNLEDVMKTTMDAYETRYNEIVKAHENGDRAVDYDLTGKSSLTLEQDLAGLDRAYRRQLAGIAGYITCQQTNDGAKFFGGANKKENAAEQKEYTDKAVYMMQQAQKKFLEVRKQPDYKEGIGKSIVLNIMNNDRLFMQKTQELFAHTIKYYDS